MCFFSRVPVFRTRRRSTRPIRTWGRGRGADPDCFRGSGFPGQASQADNNGGRGIGEVTFKETGNGRKFTLFRFFEDDPEKKINVYARGYVEGIENGSRLKIWGRYSKHKKYFLFKRKNIMKAKKIQIL